MVMKATGIQETKNETREKRSSGGTGTLVKRDPTQLTNETEGPNGTVFKLPRSGKLGGTDGEALRNEEHTHESPRNCNDNNQAQTRTTGMQHVE